jgi:hypothetical protein
MQPNESQLPPQYQQQYQQYVDQQYQDQQRQLLASVVSGSQEVLYEAKTVFPFTLFVGSIVVDREKMTLTHRSFFKMGDVTAIRIEDILNVVANVGPFFGSVKVTIRMSNESQPTAEMHYLTRKDALNIQRIAHGYSIARQQGVDTASLPKEQLVDMLLALGNGDSPGTPSA